MTDVGIRVYFLFERRKSSAHKWILVHGYNNLVPRSVDETCSIYFTPSRWAASQMDAQGMHLLVNLMASDKLQRDELPFLTHLDNFRQNNVTMCLRVNTKATNIAQKTAAVLTQFDVRVGTVSKSSLSLHELFQFFDELEQQPDAKRNNSILRLVFQHMQLKLCSLQYPDVRVHFIVTVEEKQQLQIQPPTTATESDEIINVEDIEDEQEEIVTKEQIKEETEQIRQEEIQRVKQEEEELVRKNEERLKKERQRREEEQKIQEEIDRVEKEIHRVKEEKRIAELKQNEERMRQEEIAREEERIREAERIRKEIDIRMEKAIREEEKRLKEEARKQKEEEQRQIQLLREEEERLKQQVEDEKKKHAEEMERARLHWIEQEKAGKKRIQEMEAERKRHEEQRFEEQKRVERELRMMEEQRLREKQKRDQEMEKEKQRLEAEKREKERLEREAKIKAESSKHELSIADVYDFSGDGWDIENLEFGVSNSEKQTLCLEPSFDDMYLIPATPLESPHIQHRIEPTCETIPPCFSLLPKNVILAISDVKEETRNVTRWMQRKLGSVYPENKYSLCFISQNFSESDCATVQHFVKQKHERNEWIVVGVECEFSPVDQLSRECTTLLNEFDGRTSLLILELISMPNTTVVFETTKPFNHVWCWKYNLINTPSSQWFAKASGNSNDMAQQRQAHSTAMIRLVAYASDQAAAIVRCSAQTPVQRETYFDFVVLGCHANCNETQSLFTFINDQCSQQKIQNQRWKKRISCLKLGDALAIPISRRANDYEHDLFCIAESEKQFALAGTSGAYLNNNPKPVFRTNAATPFMQTIPTPSSYAFTTEGITTDYWFGDPCVLKNINTIK